MKDSGNNIYSLMIDTTFLFDQYAKRGIGRYGKEVVRRIIDFISKEEVWEISMIGFLTLEQNMIQLGFSQLTIEELENRISFHTLGVPVSSGLKNFKRLDEYALIINKIKPDVFFAVHFERGLPTTPVLRKRLRYVPKTIVVAHDVIPLVLNSFSEKSFIHNKIKKWFYKKFFEGVKRADLVLANSNHTEKDLIKYGRVNPEKIKVVYHGITKSFDRKLNKLTKEEMKLMLEKNGLEEGGYFLYDSGLEANKGIFDLLEIFKILKLKYKNNLPQKLVLVGGDFEGGEKIIPKNAIAQKVLNKIRSLNIEKDVVTTGRISDFHLRILFFNAGCYINLSLYEGFGLGPLQAMIAGIPVITSNASCFPEVTDGGAWLIDSKNHKKASVQIYNFLTHEEIIKKYKQRASQVVKKYSWDDTALKTWNEIKKLAKTQ